jgi:hypothetical protein
MTAREACEARMAAAMEAAHHKAHMYTYAICARIAADAVKEVWDAIDYHGAVGPVPWACILPDAPGPRDFTLAELRADQGIKPGPVVEKGEES